jgi:invasion protein IalB
MDHLFASAPGWPVRAAALTVMALAVLGAPVYAQQPATPKAAQPKTKAPPQPAPTPTPTPTPTPAPPPAAVAPTPQFTFSLWTKVCVKPQDPNTKQICITSKDGFLEDGRLAVSAAVLESEGEPRKLLKIMLLPLGLQIPPGTRVTVDQGQPMSGPYAACFINGCFADYEATADLIGRMKQGQNLIIQGVSVNNQIISVSLPLGDFGKAIDGPPPDAKIVEEQRKKLQEEVEGKMRALQQRSAPAAAPKQ